MTPTIKLLKRRNRALPSVKPGELQVGSLYKFRYDSGQSVIGVIILVNDEPAFLPLKVPGSRSYREFSTGDKLLDAWTGLYDTLAGKFYSFTGTFTISNEG